MHTALRISLIEAFAMSGSPALGQSDPIAIDVLIQPDSRMPTEAQTWNARNREQSPEGFELDEEHAPHFTLIQMFVAESDLPEVLAAVDGVRSMFDLESPEMTAIGLYHLPSGTIGLAGIVIEPSEDLRALQRAAIEAVYGHAREGGGEAAFVPDRSGTRFDPFLFEYVETSVPSQTGEQFNPHVTIGVAPLGWLRVLEEEPFDRCTFGAKGIATDQLGNFGTASKRLDGESAGCSRGQRLLPADPSPRRARPRAAELGPSGSNHWGVN